VDGGRRRTRVAAGGDQARAALRHRGQRHEQDDRVGARDRLPVHRLRLRLVPRRERHCRRNTARGQRDSRVCRDGGGRAHPGHHLESDAGRGQRLALLGPAPEDERVATLEPHDSLAVERPVDQHPVDVGLAERLARR
jgi:hypothetical protein